MASTLISFEYIDRDYDRKAVLIEQFEKITSKDQIKVGDRFICPKTSECKGILDSKTELPILLHRSRECQSEWHITRVTHKSEVGKYNAGAIAWDLCYRMRDDI